MNEEDDTRVEINISTPLGVGWASGWLFAIGFAKLAFWKAVIAIVIWPYYLGAALR